MARNSITTVVREYQKMSHKSPESSFNADFLEEEDTNATTKGLISSLMSDSSRNPFELIGKEEYSFPSTPSNNYSSRLLANAEGRYDQDKSTEESNSLSGVQIMLGRRLVDCRPTTLLDSTIS